MLHLNNTDITDKDLQLLKSLTNLQLLNLVNIKVTVSGIEQLVNFEKLKFSYIHKTNVKAGNWLTLKNIFPDVMLDIVGYTISFLSSGSTEVKPPVIKKN